MAKEYLTISEEQGVVRVDKFMAQQFPEYSRAALTKLFDLNLIKKDGVPLRPGEKLRPGSIVEYDLGPLQQKPEVVPLPILYEDNDVIVIDKPAGIISHARGKFWQEASVASFIRDRVAGLEGERAGIVHRLDRATSGVMICAKNEKSLAFLQKQFHDRKVTKVYNAVVDKSLPHKRAIIDVGVERNPTNPKEFCVSIHGKQAVTTYNQQRQKDMYTLVELIPKTGRTHQLRLHLAYIGCPIVGDSLYGGSEYSRLLLHACSLAIELPSGEQKTFTSILPKDFTELFLK